MNYYNNELFHSETYLGADYTDELQHRQYKYIRRYKNARGKWTYVYADKNTHNQIMTDQIRASLYRQENKRERDSLEVSKHVQKYAKSIDARKDIQDKWKDSTDSIQSKISENARKANSYDKLADEAIRKNSVKSLAKDQVDKGVSAINKLFAKIRKK